jgi:proline iminopeptidase
MSILSIGKNVACKLAFPSSFSTAVQVVEWKTLIGEHSRIQATSIMVFLHIARSKCKANKCYLSQYFDPTHYRSILFDQRGSGRSTPHASLVDNTTWSLVSDIEALRAHLNIPKWLVFGGSWGSTLTLAYSETHPDKVAGLILRGIFTLRKEELLWFYQKGADMLFPDYFQPYKEAIPEAERGDLMGAYHRRLTGDDEAEKLKW